VGKAAGKSVVSATIEDFSGMGGLNATMRRLVANFADGSMDKYVYKTVLPDSYQKSRDLGLPREAFFYQYLAPTLAVHGVQLPQVVFVHGDMSTGEKTMILEDLSSQCVQSGYFFGPGSPHNWGKDLAAVIAANRPASAADNISMFDVARAAFRNAANMHATYWMDKSILQHEWLRSQAWMQGTHRFHCGHVKYRTSNLFLCCHVWCAGQDRESWEKAQKYAEDRWQNAKETKMHNPDSTVKWDNHLVRCMDASFAKISWEVYQTQVQRPDYQWTLVHGDFHPANILWRWPQAVDAAERGNNSADTHLGSPVLLDFEVVGLGGGAQDLAQYLISHASRADRQQHEEALLRDYYDHLTQSGSAVSTTNYSYEQCRRDFVTGGVCRWVWLLGLLANFCPDPMVQFFHDQVLHFMLDHNITPENIDMPRV
jgi:thiamine kinase-like enzyme